VKKSRALSTPAEVDENDNDEEEFADALEPDAPTPSPQPSPPHETKTRQLSQGADDTGLRNGQSERQDNVDPVAPVEFDNAATPDTQPQIGTSSLTPAATIPKMQNQTDIAEISSPGGVAAKGTIEETAATTSVEHATAPSPADAVPTTTEQVLVRPTTSAKPIPQSEAQYTQKIDNQTSSVPVTEARADSNAVKRPTPPLSEADCATKRPREDGDQDPNPREAKRASPPPEKEKEKEKEKREKPARRKSVADSHAQSTLASPRATHASGFVSCLCRCLFQAMSMLIRP
jgi:Ran-binding protein 3